MERECRGFFAPIAEQHGERGDGSGVERRPGCVRRRALEQLPSARVQDRDRRSGGKLTGRGAAVLDLDYEEDSQAGCDGNFVLTGDGAIVEAQLTAEGECFDEEGLLRLLRLARLGCDQIFREQLKAVGK